MLLRRLGGRGGGDWEGREAGRKDGRWLAVFLYRSRLFPFPFSDHAGRDQPFKPVLEEPDDTVRMGTATSVGVRVGPLTSPLRPPDDLDFFILGYVRPVESGAEDPEPLNDWRTGRGRVADSAGYDSAVQSRAWLYGSRKEGWVFLAFS